MITLTLLHPIQSIPVQSWTFEHEAVIRIGRSTDNQVILYSAVVSRHHVELRQVDLQWEVVSLGANGTYVDGKRITQMPVVDSLVIRLARSGPNIQIHVGSFPTNSGNTLQGDRTLAQRAKPTVSNIPATDISLEPSSASLLPSLAIPVTKQPEDDSSPLTALSEVPSETPSEALVLPATDTNALPDLSAAEPPAAIDPAHCTHPRAQGDVLFCPDCGQPLQVIQTVRDYQVIKTIHQDAIGITQLGWRNGQSLVLRTLNPERQQPEILETFTQQAKQLLTLDHPGLPHFADFFVFEEKPYLVQRQVYGQSLQQRVSRQGVLTAAEAIAMIVQVCDTLDYLHQQSPPLLHEDLKPENLIQQTTATGHVTLVGFLSLHSLVAHEQSVSASYSAPEQAQGQTTVTTDLFALGAILVYLLTGQAPEAFYAQREQGFRFYPEYVPGLPTALVPIVRRLTSPQPEDRYVTAKEVAAALLDVSIERI